VIIVVHYANDQVGELLVEIAFAFVIRIDLKTLSELNSFEDLKHPCVVALLASVLLLSAPVNTETVLAHFAL
jgi:hypothetical protein